MMRVFFVRHGQSQHNLEKRASGWSQVPLSDLGHEQARAVAPLFEGIKIDKVFSSDLLRVRQTAADVLPGCNPIFSDKIREISVGNIAGTLRTELAEKYGSVYTDAQVNRDYTPFGGENDDMVHERVCEFMRELEKVEGCENVVVFAHEGTVHQVLNYVLKTRTDIKWLRIPNCSVSVFLFDNGRWRLEKFAYTRNLIP